MNTERLNILANWLEAGAPHEHGIGRFDMHIGVGHSNLCGTICCIAGAATQFFGGDEGNELRLAAVKGGQAPFHNCLAPLTVYDLACELLDLNDHIAADELFCPTGIEEGDWSLITPAAAAITIRKLIATGEVDWSHVTT